jgi:hypothetical protein
MPTVIDELVEVREIRLDGDIKRRENDLGRFKTSA